MTSKLYARLSAIRYTCLLMFSKPLFCSRINLNIRQNLMRPALMKKKKHASCPIHRMLNRIIWIGNYGRWSVIAERQLDKIKLKRPNWISFSQWINFNILSPDNLSDFCHPNSNFTHIFNFTKRVLIHCTYYY